MSSEDLDLSRAEMFFGIHPGLFVDDVINAGTDCFCDCVDEVEEVCLNDAIVSKNEKAQQLVHEACDKMLERLLESLEINFGKFERRAIHIMRVPEGIDIVPELTAPESLFTAEQEEEMSQEIERLECEIAAASYMKQELEEEDETLATQLDELERCREQFEQMTTSLAAEGVDSLPAAVVKVVADTREMGAQTKKMQRALERLQDKENRKDPLNRLVPEYQRARRAFGSASTTDLAAAVRLVSVAQ